MVVRCWAKTGVDFQKFSSFQNMVIFCNKMEMAGQGYTDIETTFYENQCLGFGDSKLDISNKLKTIFLHSLILYIIIGLYEKLQSIKKLTRTPATLKFSRRRTAVHVRWCEE